MCANATVLIQLPWRRCRRRAADHPRVRSLKCSKRRAAHPVAVSSRLGGEPEEGPPNGWLAAMDEAGASSIKDGVYPPTPKRFPELTRTPNGWPQEFPRTSEGRVPSAVRRLLSPPSAPLPACGSPRPRPEPWLRSLPGTRPTRDTESPVLSWQRSLPFVCYLSTPNLQEGACFQYALGGRLQWRVRKDATTEPTTETTNATTTPHFNHVSRDWRRS
jgi:hypothetical protein